MLTPTMGAFVRVVKLFLRVVIARVFHAIGYAMPPHMAAAFARGLCRIVAADVSVQAVAVIPINAAPDNPTHR